MNYLLVTKDYKRPIQVIKSDEISDMLDLIASTDPDDELILIDFTGPEPIQRVYINGELAHTDDIITAEAFMQGVSLY